MQVKKRFLNTYKKCARKYEIKIIYISPNVVAINSTDDEISNYQIPINDLNNDNMEQQEFADNNDSVGVQMAAESPPVVLFKCPHCVYGTTVKYNLSKHIRTQHTHKNVKPFKCAKCSFAAKEKSNLHKHERTCKALRDPMNVNQHQYR